MRELEVVLLKLFKGDRLSLILILCPASIQACAGSRKARGVGVAGEAHPNRTQRIGVKSNFAAGPRLVNAGVQNSWRAASMGSELLRHQPVVASAVEVSVGKFIQKVTRGELWCRLFGW